MAIGINSGDGDVLQHQILEGDPVINSDRELTAIRKDGTVFPISLRVREIGQRGHRTYIGTVQDITERKESEDAMAELCGYIRELAHERRKNPEADLVSDRRPKGAAVGSAQLDADDVVTGGDVLKFLALGADAVMIGRPISWHSADSL